MVFCWRWESGCDTAAVEGAQQLGRYINGGNRARFHNGSYTVQNNSIALVVPASRYFLGKLADCMQINKRVAVQALCFRSRDNLRLCHSVPIISLAAILLSVHVASVSMKFLLSFCDEGVVAICLVALESQ